MSVAIVTGCPCHALPPGRWWSCFLGNSDIRFFRKYAQTTELCRAATQGAALNSERLTGRQRNTAERGASGPPGVDHPVVWGTGRLSVRSCQSAPSRRGSTLRKESIRPNLTRRGRREPSPWGVHTRGSAFLRWPCTHLMASPALGRGESHSADPIRPTTMSDQPGEDERLTYRFHSGTTEGLHKLNN